MKAVTRREHFRSANQAARDALYASATPEGQNANSIGASVFWDPTIGWTMDAAQVETTFRAHGLEPESMLPGSPDWTKAFARSVASVRSSIATTSHTMWEVERGASGEQRFAIMQKDKAGDGRGISVGIVACPKSGDLAPYVESPDSYGYAARVVAESRLYYGRYISEDVRICVAAIFERWGAISLRSVAPHVCYWLPDAGVAEIDKLAGALSDLAWGRLGILTIARDERSIRTSVGSVNCGLEAMLGEFSKEAEKYAAADAGRTRVSTIESKIVELKALKAKADLLRAILGSAVTSVDARVDLIEESFRETLGIVCAARDASDTPQANESERAA